MDGIACIYINCSKMELFQSIEKLFIEQGISLADSSSGFVKMLDENYNLGDYKRNDLLDNLSQNDQVSFQWWWGEAEDLYCRIRSVGQLSIIELGIDYTTKSQTEKILLSILKIFHNLRDIIVGIIIDRSGYVNMNNYSIDELFIEQTLAAQDMGIALGISLKEEITFNNTAQQIAEITNVIQESVVVGTRYESREKIFIFG
ncbi:hypothetical protein J2T12_000874 [Paenibacillus anaericanus]|uniref:hypothetical protein n=1 Tax=Paenibacillus anaericanus TaxID=170367 RepID=UPI00278A596D|nr:hypothetical protein [Paenibacillus anaericanus]MDQ0087480.1 hypothetical protein [Paenibacillus anaericanus]